MPDLILSLLIAACLALLWYGVAVIRLFRGRGIDPTRVTYVTPLKLYSYRPASAILGLIIITYLLNLRMLALIAAAILLFFAVAQIFLLTSFGRVGTQPLAFYYVTALGAAQAMILRWPWVIVASLILIIAQIFVLKHWLRHETRYYNAWVARKVQHINKKYGHVASNLSQRDWFYILHFAVTESIARPALSRFGERLYFHIKKPAYISSGIMQVKANKLLSNDESMRRGSKIVTQALKDMPKRIEQPIEQLKWLAKEYNGSQNPQANADYTGYLTATYPGLLLAWESIKDDG